MKRGIETFSIPTYPSDYLGRIALGLATYVVDV